MLTAIVRVVDRIATIKYNFDCGNNLKFYSMNSLTAHTAMNTEKVARMVAA
jgi:hypothetical protein